MCGIAGQVAVEGRVADRAAVERMCAALVHRGPDAAGSHCEEHAVLGMRRLSIIDVAHGDQPLYNETRSVAVVCNGEIYNYRELRRQLLERGHRFATASDVEVLAHLYEERGARLVDDLRGMFAFALWDAAERRLLLARDRVGKKPLYYYEANGRLSFASELASLLEDRRIARRADPQAIDAYLALLYVPHPGSAIEGVRRLPPASTLIWHDGKKTIERYWELSYEPKEEYPADELHERIRAELRDAVRVRLMSERPLGVFLSGGVDSAAVVATMAELAEGPVRTFSIGFRSDRFNELPNARRVAELYGTEHTEHVVDPNALSVLPELITHYGEPFGDSSSIPSYYVAQTAARSVTVALNGDGGDESFGGYNRYAGNMLSSRIQRLPSQLLRGAAHVASFLPEPVRIDSTRGRLRRLALGLPLSESRRYAMSMTYVSDGLRRELYQPDFAAEVDSGFVHEVIGAPWRASKTTSIVDRMLDVDVQTYLPGDLLVKMDIATMANSLEARSPFLDHRLMEFAAKLPATAKVQGTRTKVALKEAMRGALPADLIDRPKAGFSVPLAEWVRGPLHAPIRSVLADSRTRERGIIRPEVSERLLEEHTGRRADRSSELWLLFVLELWHRRFIDSEQNVILR